MRPMTLTCQAICLCSASDDNNQLLADHLLEMLQQQALDTSTLGFARSQHPTLAGAWARLFALSWRNLCSQSRPGAGVAHSARLLSCRAPIARPTASIKNNATLR